MKYLIVLLAIVLAAACSNPTAPKCELTTSFSGSAWTVHYCHGNQRIDCIVSNTASHSYTEAEAIEQCKREDW